MNTHAVENIRRIKDIYDVEVKVIPNEKIKIGTTKIEINCFSKT